MPDDHIMPYVTGVEGAAEFPPNYADMADALPSGRSGARRRIGFLIKNLKMSGGNRVILSLFDMLIARGEDDLHVFVVPEAKFDLKELWTLVACKRRYGAAASVTRAWRPIDPAKFDLLFSTSRRTLDFVADLAHPAHVHLFQAVEAWDTENTQPFLEHCRHHRYPDAQASIDLVQRIGLPQDLRYLGQIASVARFLAVSEYLANVARTAAQPREVTVRVPPLNIRGGSGGARRDIDVLMFLRGFVYNGDDVTLAIAEALADTPYRITIVAGNYSTRAQVNAIPRRDRLSIIREPSDEALAALYASTRVVVHPSLCNGGGFIPFEALSFGCAAVASRTGWLMYAQSRDPLAIIDRHDPQLYLREVQRLLQIPVASTVVTSPAPFPRLQSSG